MHGTQSADRAILGRAVGVDLVDGLSVILASRAKECAAILAELLVQPKHAFDGSLRQQIPQQKGLYVITTRDLQPICLHAGQSPRAKEGLRSRVWSQHFTGGGQGAAGDLVQKVIDRGKAINKAEAQSWIRSNCLVQWIVVEDDDLRCWTEHYMLSLLRPEWGR